MTSLLHDWFSWPDGSVLTNLVASAICVGFGVWRIIRSHKKLHRKLEQMHDHILDLHRHHGVKTTKHS